MVKTIKIENFKSIQSLEIELGRVNVFIGENGCGKTNILEAITMGGAAAADKLDNVFLANRGIRVTEPRYMKSGFEKENEEKDTIIEISNEQEEKIVITNDWLNKRKIETNVFNKTIVRDLYSGATAHHDLGLEFEGKELNEQFRILIEQRFIYEKLLDNLKIKDFTIYSPENYILRKYESDYFTENLGVNGEGLVRMLKKLYSENKLDEIKENLALIDWFDDFEIVNDAFRGSYLRIKDRFLNEEMTYSSFKSVNEGFLFLLFYLTLFISEYTPKFFAIDNIDNALNPKLGMRLIKVLAELAQKHEKQVIMTTHNPAILDGLNLNDDEQRLFAIYRNADGHTKARRILKPEVPAGVEPARMSELFLRGAIGGIPKNF